MCLAISAKKNTKITLMNTSSIWYVLKQRIIVSVPHPTEVSVLWPLPIVKVNRHSATAIIKDKYIRAGCEHDQTFLE